MPSCLIRDNVGTENIPECIPARKDYSSVFFLIIPYTKLIATKLIHGYTYMCVYASTKYVDLSHVHVLCSLSPRNSYYLSIYTTRFCKLSTGIKHEQYRYTLLRVSGIMEFDHACMNDLQKVTLFIKNADHSRASDSCTSSALVRCGTWFTFTHARNKHTYILCTYTCKSLSLVG